MEENISHGQRVGGPVRDSRWTDDYYLTSDVRTLDTEEEKMTMAC